MITDVLANNLLSPITLSFALGVLACQVRSEFTLPKAPQMHCGWCNL